MSKKDKTNSSTAIAPWTPNTAPGSAALMLQASALDLNVDGRTRMQVSLDSVELGVTEFNLDLPGIRLRIAL